MSQTSSLYERDQRQRILRVILWLVLAATFILGALNIQYQSWVSVVTLFGLSLLCVPALVLNSRGHVIVSASILTQV
jgi:hypothetical protein